VLAFVLLTGTFTPAAILGTLPIVAPTVAVLSVLCGCIIDHRRSRSPE
jgi:hypothetical protein